MRHRIETPASIEQAMPKPNMESLLSPNEAILATPTLGWTPPRPGFDVGLSPMLFGSPFGRTDQMSPWGKGTPSLIFASPRIPYPPPPLDLPDKD
jgi:hypothetical protein